MSSSPTIPDTPHAVFDRLAFPHIFDQILHHCPLSFFRNLRMTSWEMFHRANSVLYAHVRVTAVESHDRYGRPTPSIFLLSAHDRTRIPGLKWDPNDPRPHALTLLRLQAYTRVVDDRGKAYLLAYADTLEACSLLAALSRVQVVRAPSLDANNGPSDSWAAAINPPSMGSSRLTKYLQRVAVARRLLNGAEWSGEGTLPLLGIKTSMTLTKLVGVKHPIIHTHGHLPTVTTAIINVVFSDTAISTAVVGADPSQLPPALANVVVLVDIPPKGGFWRWAGKKPNQYLGVLHTIIDVVSSAYSRIRTVTLVGIEDVDPEDYGLPKLGLHSPWDQRKATLETALDDAVHASRRNSIVPPSDGVAGIPAPPPPEAEVAISQTIQRHALERLRLYGVEQPNAAWPAQFHPRVEPIGPRYADEPSSGEATPLSSWQSPKWRLLTFDEWRREVGDETYALATVAPWHKWPYVLPHTKATMAH